MINILSLSILVDLRASMVLFCWMLASWLLMLIRASLPFLLVFSSVPDPTATT